MQEVDASEIDRRLRRENARSGDVRVSLMWNQVDDLDLHVITPNAERIYFDRRSSSCGGHLDVDQSRLASNACTVKVHCYSHRTLGPIHFKVRVENRGSTTWYSSVLSYQGKENLLTKRGGGMRILRYDGII